MISETATHEIMKFIKNNPGCSSRKIIEYLNLKPELVIEIVNQFIEDGTVVILPIGKLCHKTTKWGF
jgi:hypothetical protein